MKIKNFSRLKEKKLFLINSLSSVSFLIFLGRIAGFGRELILSNKVGANSTSDLVILLLNLPDMLLNIILGGGLSITVVPLIQRLKRKEKALFTSQILLIVGLLFIFISCILYINKELLILFLAPGLSKDIYKELLNPLNFVLIAIPFTGLAGVTASILNSENKFRLGSSGTLIFNLSIIIFLIFKIPILWNIAYGVLAGSILRFVLQLNKINFSKNLKEIFFKSYLKIKDISQLISNFSFVTSISLLPVIARSYSSLLEEGSISLFNYSFKLIQLPVGVIIGSISIVFLSIVSKDSSNKNISNAIKLTTMLSFSLSIIMVILSKVLVQTVYFKADFNDQQFSIIHDLTFFGFLFFLPYSLVSLFGSIFAALGKTKIQFYVGIFLILYNLASTPILIKISGLNGIMISYGSSFIFAAVIQFIFLLNLRGKNIIKEILKLDKKILFK